MDAAAVDSRPVRGLPDCKHLQPVAVDFSTLYFGSLTTLLAAYGTYKLRNKPILAAACPVVANGLIVGTMVWALSHEFPLLIQIGLIALGEFGSVFVGMVLLTVLKSRVDFNKNQQDVISLELSGGIRHSCRAFRLFILRVCPRNMKRR